MIEWGWVGYEEFCRSRRVLSTEAEGDNTRRYLQNSSYPTKAEFNNCFIINSKYFPILKFPTIPAPPQRSSFLIESYSEFKQNCIVTSEPRSTSLASRGAPFQTSDRHQASFNPRFSISWMNEYRVQSWNRQDENQKPVIKCLPRCIFTEISPFFPM